MDRQKKMLSSGNIPKPNFHSCDETSLKLQWDPTPFKDLSLETNVIKLQYKEIHEKWEQCKEFIIPSSKISQITVTEADVVDLKPGTPYYVRIAVFDSSTGESIVGPETVFDTKPVDCTPKRKKGCCIS